jgi:bifunctional DNase/RNase
MIDVRVLGLTLDNATKAPILVLRAERGEDILPLWIGAAEAMAISLALAEAKAERPLTHDLMINMMRAMDMRLIGMSIVDLRTGVFYGVLDIMCGERALQLDCRPTDGIVLALRTQAPIRVADAVLSQAPRERYLAAVAGQQILQGEDGGMLFDERADPQPANATSAARPPFNGQSLSAKVTLQPGKQRHISVTVEEDPYIKLLRTLEPASKHKM